MWHLPAYISMAVAFTGLHRGRGEMALRGDNLGPRGERVGGVGPPWLVVSRFTILSQFFVMLVFLFCKLFEHYSQTNFPKDKAFQGNRI